jgi:transcription elongation factor Elf1
MADIIQFPEKENFETMWECADCGSTDFQLRLCKHCGEGIAVCSKCYLSTDFYWGYKTETGSVEVPPID